VLAQSERLPWNRLSDNFNVNDDGQGDDQFRASGEN